MEFMPPAAAAFPRVPASPQRGPEPLKNAGVARCVGIAKTTGLLYTQHRDNPKYARCRAGFVSNGLPFENPADWPRASLAGSPWRNCALTAEVALRNPANLFLSFP